MSFLAIVNLRMLFLSMGICCILIEVNGGWDEEVGLLRRGGGRGYQREFDYFKLSLQWPGTYCRRTRHCCSSNACCSLSNSPSVFTIHGLWTEYNDGTWPSCCSGHPFDEREISTLLKPLRKYWPSLSCGSPRSCHHKKGPFWGHEEVLFEAGYVPSNSEKYPLGGIISAIENAFHTTPELVCSGDALEELRICFYKNFEGLEAIPQQRLSLQNGLWSNQIILQRCRMTLALLFYGEACHNTSLGLVNPFSRVNLQVDE